MKAYAASMAILSTVMCVLAINACLSEKSGASIGRILNAAVWTGAAAWGLIVVFGRIP